MSSKVLFVVALFVTSSLCAAGITEGYKGVTWGSTKVEAETGWRVQLSDIGAMSPFDAFGSAADACVTTGFENFAVRHIFGLSDRERSYADSNSEFQVSRYFGPQKDLVLFYNDQLLFYAIKIEGNNIAAVAASLTAKRGRATVTSVEGANLSIWTTPQSKVFLATDSEDQFKNCSGLLVYSGTEYIQLLSREIKVFAKRSDAKLKQMESEEKHETLDKVE